MRKRWNEAAAGAFGERMLKPGYAEYYELSWMISVRKIEASTPGKVEIEHVRAFFKRIEEMGEQTTLKRLTE